MVAISFDGKRFRIDGPGEPVEYAVHMRQLPADRTMGKLAAADRVSAENLERLGTRLADFHRGAPRIFDPAARLHAHEACLENFRQTRPHVGRLLDAWPYDSVRTATFNFFARNSRFFEKRLKAGRFRDGHGDLRTEHVYFLENGQIQILDCIEFNPKLRQVDTASDLAFLVMDLEYHQQPGTARYLIDSYRSHSDDDGLLCLIDFYKCYRAMVRCKVNCLTLDTPGLDGERRRKLADGARNYLYLAHRYARRFDRPTLWVFCGIPASGKSALADELAGILAIESHNSDHIRKQLYGLDPLTPVSGPTDEGLYASEVSSKVYDRLFQLARKSIREGYSVILDATYSASAHRRRLVSMVTGCGARIFFIECIAPDEVLRQRLKNRENGQSVSDARLEHFTVLSKRFEPLTEIDPGQHIRLDTTRPMETCMHDLQTAAYLDKLQDNVAMPRLKVVI